MAKMSTESLTASYGAGPVIQEVSLAFQERSVTAIIGPSGCGKSTFLRCLNRMHETVPKAKVSGKVLLDGNDIYAEDPTQVRRRIGMVFQRPNPFPTMSIFDNVAASLKFNGKHSRAETDEIVLKSLQAAALWDEVHDKLFKPATSLSGGQQQRLCIARALAAQPEVLLMDEPCSALDPISTAKIEDLIFGLKRTYCVIIVTHNMQQAARVADRTAFLYLGKLVEYNDTKEMFERPKEKLTEAYVSGRFG
ncbi:MAG: phosphate ABC transporter ATP-binding protein PstB [Thermoplasmata archaeon]|nr:phosphate ABC transporter ATP-binding protein PstB [Thermoplasmata archaeon]